MAFRPNTKNLCLAREIQGIAESFRNGIIWSLYLVSGRIGWLRIIGLISKPIEDEKYVQVILFSVLYSIVLSIYTVYSNGTLVQLM